MNEKPVLLSRVRSEIISMDDYVAGKPPKSGAPRSIKLASNENRWGSSPAAISAISNALKNGLYQYSDSHQKQLKEALCAFWGRRGVSVTPDRCIFGDGSGEVLHLALSIFLRDGDIVLVPERSFILYSTVTLPKGAKIVNTPRKQDFTIDLKAMAKAVHDNPSVKAVIVCNPDNPTGTMLDKTEIREFLSSIPQTVAVILDEAYIHFAGMEHSMVGEATDYPNLIVSHTFAKAYGLAGLRVGYALAHPAIAMQMEKIRLPFNLGSLQQAGAIAALSDEAFLEESVENTKASIKRMRKMLGEYGFKSYPTSSNFFLADFGDKAAEIIAYLEDSGITLRHLVSFGFEPNYVRISAGTEEDLDYFEEILKKYTLRSNL